MAETVPGAVAAAAGALAVRDDAGDSDGGVDSDAVDSDAEGDVADANSDETNDETEPTTTASARRNSGSA